MAKISFSKLNKIKNLPPVKHQIGEYQVEIEQYLPMEKKVELMQSIIAQAGNGEEGFFNIVKLEAYYQIEMLQAYTNISFTDKQLEESTKLFDAIKLNGIWEDIGSLIPESERFYVWDNTLNLAREITTYNNSILGVLRNLDQQKSFETLDFENLMKELSDSNNLPLVRGMLTKNM